MLTEEQKDRVFELRAKEDLTEEEQNELAELEADAVLSDEDEFDKAFNEAMNEDDSSTNDNEDKDEDEQDKSDDADESIFNKPDEKNDDEPTELEKAQAEIARLNQKMSSWEGRIKKANERAEAAESKLKDKEDKTTVTVPDGEDEEALKEFLEEFPSFKKPIELMISKQAAKLVDDKVGDLNTKIETVEQNTQRVTETINSDATKKHFAAIEEAHSDYKEIYESGKLTKWIESQPSYLRPALNDVVTKGSADEVIELYDSFKESTGYKSVNTNKSDKTKSKTRNLLAVDGSSGGPPTTSKGKKDKNDFDSGWDDALKEG